MIKPISFSSSATIVPQCLEPRLQIQASNLSFQLRNNNISSSSARLKRRPNYVVSCESTTRDDDDDDNNLKRRSKLEVGSPVVFVEAPKIIKTDTAISCLKVNNGIVKPGDVGRIVSRKPKDVWAVRISIGTYLIDGKYFRPLELDS